MKELYMLRPESSKFVIDSLTDCAQKNDITLNAFYLLYGIGVVFDGIKDGEELYNYFQQKSSYFLSGTSAKLMNYLKQMDKNSDLYKIGQRLMITLNEKELGVIFYNNHHKEELIKIFNEELF